MDIKRLTIKYLGDAAAVVLFILIAFMYFRNPVQQHMVLDGVDNNAALGSNREMVQYRADHDGERTRWTNTLFSGMPTYQMSPSYNSTDKLSAIEDIYKLGLPNVMAYVFMMLLGFYIMLRAFDFKSWMAALGAVLWAFSSYYFIIIAAGHIWKLLTLCFIPPTIGGMVLCYRGKYLWGAAVTALFTGLQILSNHVQMTYYFLFLIAFMAIGFLLEALKESKAEKAEKAAEAAGAAGEANVVLSGEAKVATGANCKSALAKWLKASCAFAVGGILGVCINSSNLFHTWQYSKETMRSKSELTGGASKDEKNQTKDGLDRDYITAWSYGGDELLTLMVPNAKGGHSAPLSMEEVAMEEADLELANFEMADPQVLPALNMYDMMSQYHGEQPGTSGPVYVGAFVIFLFFLALFIVKGPMTWCLLCATMLSIFLSLGRNMMSLTDLFLDYVPMYDKFRTPASILVVAEFTMPLLALMGLKKLLEDPGFLSRKDNFMLGKKAVAVSNMTYFYLALGLTAGACLLLYICPGIMGDFTCTSDAKSLEAIHNLVNSYSQQLDAYGIPYKTLPADFDQRMMVSIGAMRQAMFQADLMRSFWFIVIGAGIVFGATRLMAKTEAATTRTVYGIVATCALLLLCLVDMWGVNKRYLNDDNFKYPEDVAQIQATQADQLILDQDQQDGDVHARVLNLTVSTFNDNTTSYFHNSIGGYHAAKLRRYQELINAHIAPEAGRMNSAVDGVDPLHSNVFLATQTDSVFPVLNMLNMKWVIVGENQVIRNNANGNAWFVDEVKYVENADKELETLGQLNTRHQAVADKQFQNALGSAKADASAAARLVQYGANEMKYEVESAAGGVLVFSEIYYPGWTATIDGKDVEIGRVNYVLRAIQVKEGGKHSVVLKFDPQTVHNTESLANVALVITFLLFALALAWPFVFKKK